MTRCLDCGSPRTADQCPSCGLTSAAAEVMFRRRLLKRTGVFLAGSLMFPYISQIYPPLDVDLMVVVCGVIFFVALALAVILDRRAHNHQELEVLTHAYAGCILCPWSFAAFLLVYASLDSRKNVVYHTGMVYRCS